MGVEPKIVGFPPKSPFNKVFHYKPSIVGYPYFWKHPYENEMGTCLASLTPSVSKNCVKVCDGCGCGSLAPPPLGSPHKSGNGGSSVWISQLSWPAGGAVHTWHAIMPTQSCNILRRKAKKNRQPDAGKGFLLRTLRWDTYIYIYIYIYIYLEITSYILYIYISTDS